MRIKDQRIQSAIHIEEDRPNIFHVHIFENGHENFTGEILEMRHLKEREREKRGTTTTTTDKFSVRSKIISYLQIDSFQTHTHRDNKKERKGDMN